MSPLLLKAVEWIEHRTGLETAIRNFLYEDIPDSSGWRQVFGSVALFAFLTQAFTGILLAFNYSPTPGDGYNSLKYIINEVSCGHLMRGLHHWGASMMIVVVILHMAQVFLSGAYKKPRETTWMLGVVLLLITLAFGLTGYLLPWDNRAYWGTVVTTQIAGQAPLLGRYLQRLIGAENGVGVVTFARFYGLHVLLLPPLTLVLIASHIYLVRRHGVAPAAFDDRPKKKFFPEQVFKDAIAVFAAFILVFMVAALIDVPLERIADPTDTGYVPRPDWYFLFLFQMLKAFKGSWEPLGSVVLPTLAVAVLFLVPFLDRSRALRVGQRTLASSVVFVAALGWSALTAAAVVTTPSNSKPQIVGVSTSGWNELSPEELAGIAYFRDEHCSTCHNLAEGEPKPGPNLATISARKSASWMIAHFRSPGQLVPGSIMPPIQLTDAQLNTLAAFLLKLTPENANMLAEAPAFAVRAGQLYQARGCGNCHMVNGVGMNIGPPLNGLARRRTKEWIEKHFLNPKAMSAGSIMPPYNFPTPDMDALVSYLLLLPGG